MFIFEMLVFILFFSFKAFIYPLIFFLFPLKMLNNVLLPEPFSPIITLMLGSKLIVLLLI